MTDAEKEFARADAENAKKRANELKDYIGEYKSALRELEFAKTHLSGLKKRIKDDGFTVAQVEAALYGLETDGFDRDVFNIAIQPDTEAHCDSGTI